MRFGVVTTRIAALAGALLLAGGAILAPAAAPPAHADVNDFEIESFDAEYTLGRDAEGRSTLLTREHIVAVFPDFDQNRGMIRDIPRVYDGHETELAVLSVTDETGAPRDFETEFYGDFLAVIMAVPEGGFVHGAQHYVIEYRQRDVTRFFEDTGADEFYWDVNGTEWAQPFGRLSATVTLDDSLEAALDGNTSCYRGGFGSSDSCEIQREDRGFSVGETNLGPGENVSFAIGFEPGTFTAAPTPPEGPGTGSPWAPRPQHFLERVPLLLYGGGAAFIAAIGAFIWALVRGRGSRTGNAIIAQYEPPEGVTVAVAAEMLRKRSKAMTATLLDLAVRRKLRLLHHDESDQYGAQALDGSGLQPMERAAYNSIFSGGASGTSYWFDKKSTKLGDAAATLTRSAKTETKKQGLVKGANGRAIAAVIVLMLIALGLPVLHSIIVGNFMIMTVLLAIGINVLVWGLIGMAAALGLRSRPTPEGALLLDHLMGLREFIRVAEADRIRMLQSASGVEVTEGYIVKVYELLLPYAVLFGFEKEWQGELAKYYRESSPEWVYGQGSFNQALPLAAFANTVSRAPTTQATYSGSGSGGSFSSFSGGSSGGGFSGGGGGGGGGRGI